MRARRRATFRSAVARRSLPPPPPAYPDQCARDCGVASEPLPQAQHAGVHASINTVPGPPPDHAHQLFAVQDLARDLHQRSEQVELPLRQHHGAARHVDGARRTVERTVQPKQNTRRCHVRRTLASAQQGLDAGHDLAREKRLQDVVVGPDLESGHAIGLRIAGGQHENRELDTLRPQASADFEAVEAGQQHVEHDDAEVGLRVEPREREVTAIRVLDGVTEVAQFGDQQLRDAVIVLDHENAGHRLRRFRLDAAIIGSTAGSFNAQQRRAPGQGASQSMSFSMRRRLATSRLASRGGEGSANRSAAMGRVE
jgi:hypothetical protein